MKNLRVSKAAVIALSLCASLAGAQTCIDSRGSLWPCMGGEERPVLKMRSQALATENPARTWTIEEPEDTGFWVDTQKGPIMYIAGDGFPCGAVAHGRDSYSATYIPEDKKEPGDVMHFREEGEATRYVEDHCHRQATK